MQIIFTTPRLYLRKFTVEDAPLILQLNSDPEVVKYVHEPVIENISQAKEIIEKIILPQYQNNLGRWALYIRETNEFIGWCGLKHLTDKNEIDLGYRLQKKYWGKGYATEAALHTLKYAFQVLKLKEITGKAHAENTASLNILKKIGMTFNADEMEDNIPIKVFSLKSP